MVAVSRHVVSRALACARLVVINAGCTLDTQQSEMEIAERLGRLSRLAPGGTYKVPSFAEDNAVSVLSLPTTPVSAPGCSLYTWTHSFAPNTGFSPVPQTSGKGVVFGHKLKVRASDLTHHSCPRPPLTLLSWVWPLLQTTMEMLLAIGYPFPPAPGGNCRIPSFAEDNLREGKGT